MSTQLAVIPAWVVPSFAEVSDAHGLAHARARDTRDVVWMARAATLDWVMGGHGTAPVTELPRRHEPTEDEVLEERYAARSVANNREYSWELRRWADAVAWMLRWLIGEDAVCPVELPRRRPDGSLWTAEDLYAEAAGDRRLPPETRRDLRLRAEVDAQRYRDLALRAASA